MIPKVGDSIEKDGKLYLVTGLTDNEKGSKVVVWESKGTSGACMPSIWNEWVNGYDERKRRSQPKPNEYF